MTRANLPSSVISASSAGGVPAWAASTVYAVNQLVTNGGSTYICNTAHTSGSTFSGESGDWQAIGSGGGAVSSVFTRTGAVAAQTGDYTAAQVGALPSTDDLSAIATANATAANVAMNSRKITGLANGSASTDAAAFGQIPTALPPNGTAGGSLTGSYPNPTIATVPSTATGTTQTALDNSTKVATTAYTDTAVGVEKTRALAAEALLAPLLLPSTSQTGSTYTFALTDVGTVVEGNSATAQTFTIPLHSSVAFSAGTLIEVFQLGAGQITIAATGGVTLRSDGSKVHTAAQYASIGLRCRAQDDWVLTGDLS